MSEKEFWLKKETEALELAKRYERCPEDQQKAAGAREARKEAEFYRLRAEEAETNE